MAPPSTFYLPRLRRNPANVVRSLLGSTAHQGRPEYSPRGWSPMCAVTLYCRSPPPISRLSAGTNPKPQGGIQKMASVRIGSGSTPVGSTNWQQYTGGRGVYVDVDTSAAGFKTTPSYVTSIGGVTHHWATTGGSSVYSATATKFRIYVRWIDGAPLSPTTANQYKWHINWVGVES